MMTPIFAIKGQRPTRQVPDILWTSVGNFEGPGPECLIGGQRLAQVPDAAKTPIVIADATRIARIRHIGTACALVSQVTYKVVWADQPNAQVSSIGVV